MTHIIQRGIFCGPDWLVAPMLTRHKALNRMRSYCNKTTPVQREALKAALSDPGISSLPIYAESRPWKLEKGRWIYACIVFSTQQERVKAIDYLTNGFSAQVYDL